MVTLLYLTRLRTWCWRMKKAVLDYRYGHSALFDQTEDLVLAHDLQTVTVNEYLLINVDRQLEHNIAEALDCVYRWVGADKLCFAPQIIRLKAHVQACYSVIAQSADNSDMLNEAEQEQLG